MPFKSVVQYVKRHPFFYKTRFKLLSRNSDWNAIASLDYNMFNSPSEIPEIYKQIHAKIYEEKSFTSDLNKIQHLCLWLRSHIKGGPGLGLPSDRSLEVMLAGKGGVCSDFAQVFNNFCVVNGFLVREWGMTRIPFDNNYGGHSVNEVYLNDLNKWVCTDVYLCLLFFKPGNSLPLSVQELQEQLISDPDGLIINCFTEKNVEIEKSIIRNYTSSLAVMFLIHRYRNKIYDMYLKRFKLWLPTAAIHFLLYITNKSYLYFFPNGNFQRMFN